MISVSFFIPIFVLALLVYLAVGIFLFKNSWWFIIMITSTVVILLSAIPGEERLIRYEPIKIYSTAEKFNNISGRFSMWTGYIHSQEMYSGNTFDGKYYDRIYIPVLKTRRVIKNLDNVAIYKRPICKDKSTWLFYDDLEFVCRNTKSILEVPTNSIIKQMNFQ